MMDNANVGFGKDQWAACKTKFPNFAAYGERFKAENATYLNKRPVAPI